MSNVLKRVPIHKSKFQGGNLICEPQKWQKTASGICIQSRTLSSVLFIQPFLNSWDVRKMALTLLGGRIRLLSGNPIVLALTTPLPVPCAGEA